MGCKKKTETYDILKKEKVQMFFRTLKRITLTLKDQDLVALKPQYIQILSLMFQNFKNYFIVVIIS